MSGDHSRRDGAIDGVPGLGRALGAAVLKSEGATTAGTEPSTKAKPRWLLVVHENQRELYELLRQRFQETALVILDRRRGERRRGAGGLGADRRNGDRRRQRAVAWFYPAEASSASENARRAADLPSVGVQMQPTPAAVTKACAECTAVLEFEIPRFPQPPARLEADVVHTQQAGSRAEHYVEIQAFTGSGRQLVGQRIHARRVTG